MQDAAKVPPIPSATAMSAEEQRIRELRAIALCALAVDRTNLPLWKYFAQLKHLSVSGLEAEVLEARIAICLAAQIRPAHAVRMIKHLRALRVKQGQEGKFDAFEAFFKKALGDKRLTNHGYQTANFADMDHSPVWERVGSHLKVLSDRGYPAFLNSGTLLGVVRDRRLIDHDDDIDLAVILNATNPEAAAEEWKALIEDLRGLGILDEAAMPSKAIAKLLPVDKVQVDLFPAWLEEDRVFVYPHTFGDLARDDVLPLSKCAVSGNPIPAQAQKMLAVNYGESWQKPDAYFKFPWPKANRKFSAFLGALG